jgi:uncharacterized protein YbjT (DUF2867 family)
MLGGMITLKLIERGEPVRVLVRGASPLHGVEKAHGDLKDRGSLVPAMKGVTTVITTATSASRGGDDTVPSVDDLGNRNLIEIAKRSGVKQFIFVSASTANESSPVPLFAAKARVEKTLKSSGLDWTILAPHILMDVWFPLIIGSAVEAKKPVPLVAGGKRRHSFIAAEDVAEFAVGAVGNSKASKQRLLIGGPAALSWTDLVRKSAEILGRPVPTEVIEPGSPIPTLPPPLNAFIGQLAAGLEWEDVIIDTTKAANTFGVRLTMAEEVLREMLRG